MSRREEIDKLLEEARQTKDVEVLWLIAKKVADKRAFTEFNKIIERIMEIEERVQK